MFQSSPGDTFSRLISLSVTTFKVKKPGIAAGPLSCDYWNFFFAGLIIISFAV
jgi:hypothetical protein